jgi:hypothetical protein
MGGGLSFHRTYETECSVEDRGTTQSGATALSIITSLGELSAAKRCRTCFIIVQSVNDDEVFCVGRDLHFYTLP